MHQIIFFPEISGVGNGTIALALFIQKSIPLNSFTAASTASNICSSNLISHFNGRQLPPVASISFAAVKIVPGNLSVGIVVFEAITILAPRDPNFFPISRPIPLLPPVIKLFCF